MFLPTGARAIEVGEPLTGDPIYSDLHEPGGHISDATVDRSGRRPRVIWTAEPTPLLCFGKGWESGNLLFAVAYRIRRQVRVGGRTARRYVDRALRRTFGPSQVYGSGHSLACKRRSSVTVRCRAEWFAGDTSWSGPVTVWLSKIRGKLRWNYRLAITRVNEYCESVLEGTDCRDVIRRERRDLPI
jgi:hypothetical protein